MHHVDTWPGLALWEAPVRLKWGGVQQKEKNYRKMIWRERQMVVFLTGV